MVSRLRGLKVRTALIKGLLKFSPLDRNSHYSMQKAVVLVQSSCTYMEKTGTNGIKCLEADRGELHPVPQRSMTLTPSSSSSNATVMGLSPNMARSLPKSFDSSSPLFFDLQHILNMPVQI